MNRVAITGSSGYLGTALIDHFRRLSDRPEILGIDMKAPPAERAGPDEFHHMDVRDPRLAAVLEAFRPDTILHSAFIVPPMRDEARMRAINVGGLRSLLEAAARCRPERLQFISSTTAYGARPDNPDRLGDADETRASVFRYALDKVECEDLMRAYARAHPQTAVSWVRPCIVGGPGMDNYLYRVIFGLPAMVLMDGHDTPIQFVHEDDVAAGIHAVLAAGGRGAFNLAPDSATRLSEIAAATDRPALTLPFGFVTWLHHLAWTVRIPGHESPADFLHFARYRWIATSRRLQDELGFRFRFSSGETVASVIASRRTPTLKPA